MYKPSSIVGLALLAVAVPASTAAAQSPTQRRLDASAAGPDSPPRLLSVPAAGGIRTVTRSSMAAVRRDSSITRTLVLSMDGKESRRIIATESVQGQLVRVSDVSISALENVEVRFEGRQPRASWHTTNDTGMSDSAAAVAAERLAADLRRRCPKG